MASSSHRAGGAGGNAARYPAQRYPDRKVMLASEKFYEKSDIEDMLPEAEVTEPGKYWAIGDNGRAYSATYTLKYGGVFFFCIPAAVKILGYVPA